MATPSLASQSQMIQEEELEALQVSAFLRPSRIGSEPRLIQTQAIYGDFILNEARNGDGERTIQLRIPIELSTPRDVVVHPARTVSSPLQGGSGAPTPPCIEIPVKVSVSVLPDVSLDIVLPETYPFSQAPTLVKLRATHDWFVDHNALIERMLAMWQEQEGVLSLWVEYLRSGDFISDIGMEAESGIRYYPLVYQTRLHSRITVLIDCVTPILSKWLNCSATLTWDGRHVNSQRPLTLAPSVSSASEGTSA
jgi:hypothetical protein